MEKKKQKHNIEKWEIANSGPKRIKSTVGVTGLSFSFVVH